MSIFTEIKSYFNFLKKNNYSSNIVFYAEDEESYCHFEGLINEILKLNKIHILYLTSDLSDKTLKKNSKFFSAYYFNKLLAPIINNLRAKALIMTMPELDKFHIKKSQYCDEHIYIFHSIVNSIATYSHGALFSYDTIFCVGPHHKKEIKRQEKFYNLNKKKLIEFGYYKLESITNEYKKYKEKNIPSDTNSKTIKTILIAPSWGKNSILNFFGDKLINILNSSSIDYNLIIRPHPMTLKHDYRLIMSLNNKFGSFNNITFENNIKNTSSFYKSDIMITDWSGAFYEFAFGTEKPVLFIDVPFKALNHRYKEIGIEPVDLSIRNKIGEIVPANNIENINTYIDKLIRNRKSYKNSIKALREKMIYNINNSSSIGAKYIDLLFN